MSIHKRAYRSLLQHVNSLSHLDMLQSSSATADAAEAADAADALAVASCKLFLNESRL
eukprot:m.154038 g.154038  ORF g.154038 m.154038 type:complete len:58 (+) comp14298_c0_seq4:3604-3777(+)